MWDSGVECGVTDAVEFCFGEELAECSDNGEGGGIVQRGEFGSFFEISEGGGGDVEGLLEMCAAVDDTDDAGV